MVELPLQDRIDTAEWHVTKAFETVSRQRLLVFAMSAADPHLDLAKRDLSELETKLADFVALRDRVVEGMAKASSSDAADSWPDASCP